MAASPKIWAIVPAAGTGSRMMSPLPKQYLPLAGKTVLQITLDKLQSLPEVAGCIVAISREDALFAQLCGSSSKGLVSVIGGADRAASVAAALSYLMLSGCGQDWALVHDAARPCVKPHNIQKLIQEVFLHNSGGLLAVPVADTLKRVDGNTVAGHEVLTTVDRTQLWQAHTPQMFRVGELYAALASSQHRLVTDEASAMEATGVKPRVVADSRDNIKITQAEDLALAEFILRQQGY